MATVEDFSGTMVKVLSLKKDLIELLHEMQPMKHFHHLQGYSLLAIVQHF